MRTRPHHRAALPAVLVLVLVSGCAESPPEFGNAPPDSVFRAVVVPFLQERCQGCHFQGGSMYAALPFDDARVVTERGDEMLTRLEGGDRRWYATWLEWQRRHGKTP